MNKHFMSAAKKASAAVAVMVLCGMGAGVVSAETVTIKKETSTPSNIKLNHTGFYHVEGKHFVDNGCGYVNQLTNGALTRSEANDITKAFYQNDVRLANTIGSFTATEEDKDSDGVIHTTKQDGLKTEIFNSQSFQQSIITDATDSDITGDKGKYKYVSTTGTVVAAINGAYEVLDAAKADADLDNLTDAGESAIKNLAQDAVEVKGEGAAQVTTTTANGKTTYTLTVNGNGQVASGNTGLVTGDTVYNALKNEVGEVKADGTFADFAGSDLADQKTITSAINAVNGKVGDNNYTSVNYVTAGQSSTAAISALDAGLKATDNKVGDNNYTSANYVTAGQSSTAAISALDAGLKATDNKVGDNKYTSTNYVTSGASSTAAISALDSGLKATDNKVGDNQYAATNYVTAGSSSTTAIGALDKGLKATDDKVGDTQYASTKYVSAGTSATEAIGALDKGLSDLDGKLGKVGAGAAALAALHPLDYDADDKFSFAAGYGNYAGENAAALGAFYRPNENVMFSVGGTLGTGENMVNAGVSFALGHGAAAGTSKAAMAKKIEAQDEEIADLKAEVEELKAMVRELAAK